MTRNAGVGGLSGYRPGGLGRSADGVLFPLPGADASPARRSAYRQVCSESGDPFPPDTPGAARRMALYDLYLALILVIESTYRNYSPDHEAWARAFCDRALVVLKY
jgi:hypothetical protein